MDVHVLPGFLPEKKKKKEGSWGRVGVAHAAHLACFLNQTQTCQPSMMIIKQWSLQTAETAATETGSA